jgi:hypothetical protein
MPEPFNVRHRGALLWSLAFFLHLEAVKLTTKSMKDTKNLIAASA